MTSKLVVNTIEADTGISSVSFASSISMNSTAKFHFSAAGIDIGADTNINRPAAGVLGFNVNGAEKVRIDTNGHLNTSGIVTAANFKSGVTNVHNLGLTLTGGQLDVGSNIKVGNAGVITATSFVGSGANLTNLNGSNIASGTVPVARIGTGTKSSSTFYRGDGTFAAVTSTTINSNSDNRVITGSGTANTLNAESTFVHDPVNCDTKIMHNSNNPADLLVQNDSTGTGANARLTLQSGSNSNAGAMFGMITGSHAWYLQTPKNAGNLEFQKGGLKFRMDNSGDFLINDGNLVIGTAGHGIDFSADGSGTLKTLPNSLNAELLHDYENGTFTPSIQYDTGTNHYSGSNVSSAVGEYIRIGDLVSFGMKIILTGNRNYSQNIYMYIGGLPYNGMHTSQQSSMMSGWGGWVCPTNDSNSSYQVHNCKHSYTTVDVRFEQSSGTGGIDGFYAWGFYRTAP